MSQMIKLTLVKSLIGRKPNHITIAKQLGLTKINKSVSQPDNAAIRGLINVIQYLLLVEEAV
jgi:large subunit ribosomal protein L30